MAPDQRADKAECLGPETAVNMTLRTIIAIVAIVALAAGAWATTQIALSNKLDITQGDARYVTRSEFTSIGTQLDRIEESTAENRRLIIQHMERNQKDGGG